MLTFLGICYLIIQGFLTFWFFTKVRDYAKQKSEPIRYVKARKTYIKTPPEHAYEYKRLAKTYEKLISAKDGNLGTFELYKLIYNDPEVIPMMDTLGSQGPKTIATKALSKFGPIVFKWIKTLKEI